MARVPPMNSAGRVPMWSAMNPMAMIPSGVIPRLSAAQVEITAAVQCVGVARSRVVT